MREIKNAFTLSETMIVIVVLGIIATLTIPALVNKNKESVAKTKVRKAMAAYESALNKMIIENDLKDNGPLNDWAGAVDNCGNPTQYFKKVQGDGCIFKTSDGIWWNISDIERPLIAFKQDDLTTEKANAANDYSAFVLVGRFGNDGSLRVDDLAYETNNSVDDVYGNASKAQVEKLYKLLGLKSSSVGGNSTQSPFAACSGADTCVVDGITYTKMTLTAESKTYQYCDPEDWIEVHKWGSTFYTCGEDMDKWQTMTSESQEGTYWVTNLGGNKTWEEATYSCAEGTHLATIAEILSLQNSGALKCLDGSMDCQFWAEEYSPNDAYSVYIGYEDDVRHGEKSSSYNGMQTLCLSN